MPSSPALLERSSWLTLARQPICHGLHAKTVFYCPRDMPSPLAAPFPLVWPWRDPSDKTTRQITHLHPATPVQISTTIMGTSSGIEPRSRWDGGLVLACCACYSRLTMFVTLFFSSSGFGRLYTETESEATHSNNIKTLLNMTYNNTSSRQTSQDSARLVTAAGLTDVEQQKAAEGNAHFHRLGWKRLTVVLIVEAVALGCLSLPAAFATLGMVAGVILCIGIGLIAIYTSYVVGQVKLAFPQVSHYADAGQLLMERFGHGRFGYELISVMFSLQLIFLVGSHCLTGTIAFLNLTDDGACSLVFGLVSAILLLLVAIPPSFAEVAILGYIDFASIIAAVGTTIIATGIKARDNGGLSSVPWSAWPKEDLGFTEAFIAISNIVFAYCFAICQFSFMDEMHTPKDFVKSIWSLGLLEITIYTLTGSLIYAFVGPSVKSPALLSAGELISKVTFGIALPVIFISGSINTIVVGRYLHGRIFKNSIIRYINTPKGWATWLLMIIFITFFAWIIAEAIPFFNNLLSISSSLFISGFTFYFPAMMWFVLIRKGSWHSKENILKSLLNGMIFIIGIIILVGGTYASVDDVMRKFRNGEVQGPFACAPIA